MLDLLIHVTAANKISPSSHVLQVTDQDGRFLAFKPSSPIGQFLLLPAPIGRLRRSTETQNALRKWGTCGKSAPSIEQSVSPHIHGGHVPVDVKKGTKN